MAEMRRLIIFIKVFGVMLTLFICIGLFLPVSILEPVSQAWTRLTVMKRMLFPGPCGREYCAIVAASRIQVGDERDAALQAIPPGYWYHITLEALHGYDYTDVFFYGPLRDRDRTEYVQITYQRRDEKLVVTRVGDLLSSSSLFDDAFDPSIPLPSLTPGPCGQQSCWRVVSLQIGKYWDRQRVLGAIPSNYWYHCEWALPNGQLADMFLYGPRTREGVEIVILAPRYNSNGGFEGYYAETMPNNQLGQRGCVTLDIFNIPTPATTATP